MKFVEADATREPRERRSQRHAFSLRICLRFPYLRNPRMLFYQTVGCLFLFAILGEKDSANVGWMLTGARGGALTGFLSAIVAGHVVDRFTADPAPDTLPEPRAR